MLKRSLRATCVLVAASFAFAAAPMASAAPTLPKLVVADQTSSQIQNVQWDRRDRRDPRWDRRDNRHHRADRRDERHQWDKRRHGPRYRDRRPGYSHYHDGYYYSTPWWAAAGAVGAIIGNKMGNSGNSNARSHVAWCNDRYRSYNPRTDTYTGYDGRKHRCDSPYN
ncbi:Ni/Co efflux regulator RcnB [Rhodopseudomonas julia]|uniref:Lectin-like protein BA14k n=1 Tax=Rhodopseudomonas julia TaxID=200617 RepID=A0ABU0C575_9BRAD|nr:BA14K family protein [Rhodopseudomonas julia]MDQ0324815.1 Ni/Co efflux regulator RcnB [Rhodopseudomonas julia]